MTFFQDHNHAIRQDQCDHGTWTVLDYAQGDALHGEKPAYGRAKTNDLQAPIWLKCTPLTRESFYSSSKTVTAIFVISEWPKAPTHETCNSIE
jgi:hypothetical protein